LKDVRVARREALPHLRKEVRTLTDYGSAPWRAIPSHPEGKRDEEKTGLPGASTKNTGDGACLARTGQARRALRWLGCLKSESDV
jgi:hypothetical protein